MYKIVISGWYGEKNLGDEIILSSMISIIKKNIPNVDISVMSFDPEYTQNQQSINAVRHFPYSLKNLLGRIVRREITSIVKTYSIIKDADLILIGGGGFLSDWNPVAIKPWLRQIYFYKRILNKKVMLYAIGAGPFLSTKYQKKIKRALSMVDSITVRDEESFSQLLKCGVMNVNITADPAVELTGASQVSLSNNPTKKIIGVSIAPLFINDLWNNANLKYEGYLQSVIDFINKVNQKYKDELQFVFIPMQDNYDIPFNKEIINKIQYKGNVSIVTDAKTINEKLSHIKKCDLIIGMRLHSIIISSNYSIPSLGIVYHHKVAEYLKRIGMNQFFVETGDGGNWKDINIDPNEMYEKFVTLYNDISYYRSIVASNMMYLRKLNNQNIEEVKQLLETNA